VRDAKSRTLLLIARICHTYSHGCIRLTNWDASELGKIVHVGTPAILKYKTAF